MNVLLLSSVLAALACGLGSCGSDTPTVPTSTPMATTTSTEAPAAPAMPAAPAAPAMPAGDLAGGWSARLDDPTLRSDLAFAEVDGGFELKPGPNATLWHRDNRAAGNYRLAVGVTQIFSAGMHPHGAGIVFGGRELDGDGQAYTYFLVRGDGQFLIKTRTGGETSIVVPWTAHEAVVRDDPEGHADNLLAVDVGTSETRFLANGVVVYRAPKGRVPTDGLYGFRLVHDLHMRFAMPVLETR